MIILDQFVDFIKAIRIEMIAFNAKCLSTDSYVGGGGYQLKFLWVGDRCPSRHLFEIECHVLLNLVIKTPDLVCQCCL